MIGSLVFFAYIGSLVGSNPSPSPSPSSSPGPNPGPNPNPNPHPNPRPVWRTERGGFGRIDGEDGSLFGLGLGLAPGVGVGVGLEVGLHVLQQEFVHGHERLALTITRLVL